MREMVLLLCLTICINLTAYAQIIRFVANSISGAGNGSSATDAADFLSDAFWADIQGLLQKQPVTVKFAAGDYVRAYTEKSLTLNGLGHARNQLILEGDLNSTIFTAPTGYGDKNIILSISNSQNITVKNFRFTGNGSINYVSRVTSGSGKTSRNILLENCHWEDMRGIIYGASGTSQSTTSYVTYKNCTFKRIGLNSGSHMIYNAYDSHHITIIDSHFEDCTGDYIRFRDNLDYATVKGSTFVRNPGFVDYPFISMPLFNDVDPGDEIFASNYSFTNNSFTNATTAISFYSSGFDPIGRNHLLTSQEGAILIGGSVQQKKELLLNNFKINSELIRINNNTYNSITKEVLIRSVTAYGSVSKGWTGEANISNLFNNTSNLLPWEEDFLNLHAGIWNNESRTLSYNLGAGTGNATKILTGTPPMKVGGSSVSTQNAPGFLPYIPTTDGGGNARAGYPSSNAIFTLQDADPKEATLKINASGGGNPAKFSLYNIGSASPVTSMFFTIKFDNGPATQVEWTCAMGNNTGAANILSNASALTATSSTSNPEIFNAFRWRIERTNPNIIDFQYRKKAAVTGNASYTTVNSTSFYRGGEFAIEVYANNYSDSQNYTRGGRVYTIPARAYHLWSNGERILAGADNYVFPANQLSEGTNINSFMIQGTNSSSTPNPEAVVGDNSAELTIGRIHMDFVETSTLPVNLMSFDVKKQKQGVLLSWTTSSEINNSHFEIHRSSDGKDFHNLGTIVGKGNTAQRHSYNFMDTSPFQGDNYYFLRQIDFDGTIKDYEVKAVKIGLEERDEFTIYSSLLDGKVHISYLSEDKGEAILQVLSVSGQRLTEQKNLLNKGYNSFFLDGHLPKGVYVVILRSNKKMIAKKIIK